MRCEVCGTKEAAIHIQQIIGSKVVDLHLCNSCAYRKGISSDDEKFELSITHLLKGLVTSGTSDTRRKVVCPSCGMSFKIFQKEGKLGCSECYGVFRKKISLLLGNIAEITNHKGKYPSKLLQYKSLLIDKEILREKLETAVQQEDYETAAVMRDKINEIELSHGDKNGGI